MPAPPRAAGLWGNYGDLQFPHEVFSPCTLKAVLPRGTTCTHKLFPVDAQTHAYMEAGMFTVPMDFALPIVRAQRGNRGIAKEKLDPVAEAAKPQWDHKK